MESSEFIGHADWLRVVRQAERPTITFHFISSFPLFNARLVEDDGGPRLKVTIGPLRGRTLHIKVRGEGACADAPGCSELEAFRRDFADELESIRKRRT